jgi:tyrosine-protein kinase Etk/Wzc
MSSDRNLVNDQIDLNSLFSILFDNLNLILSFFLSSFLAVTVYYFSAESLYQSTTLIEIKENNTTLLPDSFMQVSSFSNDKNGLEAEKEIYKSNATIQDALKNIKSLNMYEIDDLPSSSEVRKNLIIINQSKSLMNISFVNNNEDLAKDILENLNQEFMNDRKNFFSESSAAGRKFIQSEIPRIRNLLKESEEKLNDYKISTNASDVIFDTNTRNFKLEELKNRYNEIIFKELELKEFYKKNHPIYLTLTEQKNLVVSQIDEIEKDLPSIPSTQRALENLKREVEIYSTALGDLSSQELALSMAEASSRSNVRIINNASEPYKISPNILIYIVCLAITFLAYVILVIIHFLGDKISHFDSLVDFIGKEKIIGELPFINEKDLEKTKLITNISDELLNKTIYEITHNIEGGAFSVISSRKGEGKTKISSLLFNKLKQNYKVCLIDLDYRKKGLTKELAPDSNFKNFEEFNREKNNFMTDNGSLFIPSFEVGFPQDFFTSEEFSEELSSLKKDFDYLILDTPPWRLFVDAKIISKHVDNHIYVVSDQTSTFKDINIFKEEIDSVQNVYYFYNNFKLYFNFLWYQYQYPYYSRNYYYDYQNYGRSVKNFTIVNFLVESGTKLRKLLYKWVKTITDYLKIR